MNSIVEVKSKKHLYENTSNKLFMNLNSLYSDNELVDTLKELDTKKMKIYTIFQIFI